MVEVGGLTLNTGAVWFLAFVIVVVVVVVRFLMDTSKRQKKTIRVVLRDWFLVHKERIARLSKELERKAFHVAGFIIPATYIACLESGFMTRSQCAILLGTLASMQALIEIGRKTSPRIREFFIKLMKHTMRPEELTENKATGTVYFMTGNFLVVWLYEPAVAVVSQLFLVVGDLMAALVGIAYGRIKVTKNKSLEGCLGCFGSCIVVGVLFLSWAVPLAPLWQIVLICAAGGFVATVVELYSDDGFYLNDNLTIPVSSGLIVHLLGSWLGLALEGPTTRLPWLYT